jgi:hypothetical protein
MAIVNLYKVAWHNARHNGANTQLQSSFVVAAANTGDSALGALIKTANADNQNVTVDQVQVMQTGVIQ